MIDAVEEFGALFSNYSVHLLLTLPPHEPTPRISAAHAGRLRDNTRQVLRAWALRNPRVTLHPVAPRRAAAAVTAAPASALRSSSCSLLLPSRSV